jgi:hypothetical protein
LWNCIPYSGLDIIRDQIRESKETTARLSLLVYSLLELERGDILEAVITLSTKRPLTSPADLSGIIEQLQRWWAEICEWPAKVFEETHLQHTPTPDHSQALAKIFEDVANGEPLFIGSCLSGGYTLT